MLKKSLTLLLLFFIPRIYTAQICAVTYTNLNTSFQSKGTSCIGDFNNDGKIDIVFLTSSGNNLFAQAGPGTFSTIATPTTSTYPCGAVSGDFNNDGNLDFIDLNTSPLKINFGLGNGTFTTYISNQNGSQAADAVAKDFNSDGNLDLIYVSQTIGGLFVLLGNGNGNFNAPNYFPLGVWAFDLASDDFNNDGNGDVVYSTSSGACLMIGIGTGSFNPPSCITSTVNGSRRLTVGDFNNDGNKDIAVGNDILNDIIIHFGDGLGGFPTSQTITTTVNTRALASGDINNDGKIDFASCSMIPGQTTINLYFNNGTNNLNAGTTYSIIANGNWIERFFINDFNNDAKPDLAITTYSQVNSFVFFSNNTCIYPGDANSDGIANNNDILELGLHIGLTGAARTPTSNAWNSFTCTPWTGTITTGKNMNHSDCNGDGSINLSDTLAVFNNYGFMHNLKETAPTSTPQISIVPDQSIVFKNTWGTASIYVGDATTPVNNINGVAFTVSFNKTLIQADSVYIEYIPSFINSNNLHFRKRVFNNGEIYTATTHTVNNNVSGNGKIAILHYKIKPNLVSDSTLNLAIIKASKMDGSGNLSSLTSGTGSLTASASALGLSELNSENSVMVYPNPNNGIITILSSEPQSNDELIMYNSLGQEVYKNKINGRQQTLNLNLAKGIYSYKIHRENMILKQSKIVIE